MSTPKLTIGGWGWFPIWFYNQHEIAINPLPVKDEAFTEYDYYIVDEIDLFCSSEPQFHVPGSIIQYIYDVSFRNLEFKRQELNYGEGLHEAIYERWLQIQDLTLAATPTPEPYVELLPDAPIDANTVHIEEVVVHKTAYRSIQESFDTFVKGLEITNFHVFGIGFTCSIAQLLSELELSNSSLIESMIMEDLKTGAFHNEEFTGSVFAEYSRIINDPRYQEFMEPFHCYKPAILIMKYFHNDLKHDYLVKIDLHPDIANFNGYALKAQLYMICFPKNSVPPIEFNFQAYAEFTCQSIINKQVKKILGINKLVSLPKVASPPLERHDRIEEVEQKFEVVKKSKKTKKNNKKKNNGFAIEEPVN